MYPGPMTGAKMEILVGVSERTISNELTDRRRSFNRPIRRSGSESANGCVPLSTQIAYQSLSRPPAAARCRCQASRGPRAC